MIFAGKWRRPRLRRLLFRLFLAFFTLLLVALSVLTLFTLRIEDLNFPQWKFIGIEINVLDGIHIDTVQFDPVNPSLQLDSPDYTTKEGTSLSMSVITGKRNRSFLQINDLWLRLAPALAGSWLFFRMDWEFSALQSQKLGLRTSSVRGSLVRGGLKTSSLEIKLKDSSRISIKEVMMHPSGIFAKSIDWINAKQNQIFLSLDGLNFRQARNFLNQSILPTLTIDSLKLSELPSSNSSHSSSPKAFPLDMLVDIHRADLSAIGLTTDRLQIQLNEDKVKLIQPAILRSDKQSHLKILKAEYGLNHKTLDSHFTAHQFSVPLERVFPNQNQLTIDGGSQFQFSPKRFSANAKLDFIYEQDIANQRVRLRGIYNQDKDSIDLLGLQFSRVETKPTTPNHQYETPVLRNGTLNAQIKDGSRILVNAEFESLSLHQETELKLGRSKLQGTLNDLLYRKKNTSSRTDRTGDSSKKPTANLQFNAKNLEFLEDWFCPSISGNARIEISSNPAVEARAIASDLSLDKVGSVTSAIISYQGGFKEGVLKGALRGYHIGQSSAPTASVTLSILTTEIAGTLKIPSAQIYLPDFFDSSGTGSAKSKNKKFKERRIPKRSVQIALHSDHANLRGDGFQFRGKARVLFDPEEKVYLAKVPLMPARSMPRDILLRFSRRARSVYTHPLRRAHRVQNIHLYDHSIFRSSDPNQKLQALWDQRSEADSQILTGTHLNLLLGMKFQKSHIQIRVSGVYPKLNYQVINSEGQTDNEMTLLLIKRLRQQAEVRRAKAPVGEDGSENFSQEQAQMIFNTVVNDLVSNVLLPGTRIRSTVLSETQSRVGVEQKLGKNVFLEFLKEKEGDGEKSSRSINLKLKGGTSLSVSREESNRKRVQPR